MTLLIDHILKQHMNRRKYQKDGLMNFHQVSESIGITVESVRYHVRQHNLEPVCSEKQYENSRIPVMLFAKEDVEAFKLSKHLYANNKVNQARKKNGSKKSDSI